MWPDASLCFMRQEWCSHGGVIAVCTKLPEDRIWRGGCPAAAVGFHWAPPENLSACPMVSFFRGAEIEAAVCAPRLYSPGCNGGSCKGLSLRLNIPVGLPWPMVLVFRFVEANNISDRRPAPRTGDRSPRRIVGGMRPNIRRYPRQTGTSLALPLSA